MLKLTPKLASEAPDVFRNKLIEGLPQRSVYGKHLWQTVVRSGMVSVDTVHIESAHWGSRSNAQNGYVYLGTRPLADSDKEELVFNAKQINYEQEVNLRFLHELGHLFEACRINEGSERIQSLLQTTRAVRNVNQNLGLSAIGSLPFYGADMRFREDSSELIAMYAFQPDYLQHFLSYVNNPAKSAELNTVGITTIPGYGDELYALVRDAVQEGISAL